MRTKPHRLPRERYQGQVAVSFTICEIRRRPLLAQRGLFECFLPMLAEAGEQGKCSIPIFTLMPDHMHVLTLGLQDDSDAITTLDRFMDRSGWWLYRTGNRPQWQKGYYDHIVRLAEGWESQARYIALNPVRGGLIDDPYEWAYTGSVGYDVREIIGDAFW